MLGALGFIALAYRVTFVYQLRPGGCVVGARVRDGVDAASVLDTAEASRDRRVADGSPRNGGVQPARGGRAADGLVLTAASEPATPRRPIRVLSYNIEGHAVLVRPHHLEEIAEVIRAQHPDVVALQEVHRGTWEARFHDQAAELGRLTGMTVAFGPSFRVLGGELGNAILARGPFRDVELVRLPSLGEPRSLLRARLDVNGAELEVMAAHLAAWGGLNRRIRTTQASCLAEQAHAAGRRFVLAGDFNATPTSAELAALLDGRLLRLTGLASEPTYPLLDRRIDYILASPGWEVGKSAVVHAGPSDHWPITAELMPVASPAREIMQRAAR